MLPFDLSFYKGKRVFVTGHTGFKGSWLCRILLMAGAELTGYALDPSTRPSLYEMAGLEAVRDVRGDVRDMESLRRAFEEASPQIVLHLAAQPIVRTSYEQPLLTYGTNVMGTVNLLECVRLTDCVKSFLNVTTDKVYENREDASAAYREDEPLDGYDPYSNSKSCSELVTHSYKRSFFADGRCAVSTARAGNVIGGGDFARDRIIPDCVRAASQGLPIAVRNPSSTRPYQHVLEPLFAYLMIAAAQYGAPELSGWYNVGPGERDCVSTGRLAEIFCRCWGDGQTWEDRAEKNAPHEAGFLRLDSSRIEEVFGWRPVWHIEEAVARTVDWSRVFLAGDDIPAEMDKEIREYIEA